MDVTSTASIDFLYQSQTNATSDFPECKAVFRPDLVVFQIIVFADVLWNALVLWAIFKSRKYLRQNVVYSFVSSLVVANIALTVVFVLTLFSFITPFERPLGVSGFEESPYNSNDPAHQRIMYWYMFRKALVLGLFLAMSSNVVALISGIIQNASFVGRAGATANTKIRNRQRSPSLTKHKEEKSKMTRHQKASFSIFLSWSFSFIYTILCFVQTDCIAFCDCLPGYYSKQFFCSKPSGRTVNLCSNVWNPLTNPYILTGVVIWLLAAFAMFFLLVKAVKKYQSVMKPSIAASSTLSPTNRKRISSTQNKDMNENQSIGSGEGSHTTMTSHSKTGPINGSTGTLNSIGTMGSVGTNHKSSAILSPAQRFSLKRSNRMHPTIKLLIALSVSYTLCTGPMMALFAIDAFADDRKAVNDIAVTIASAVAVGYTMICPGFLVAYMPGLRKALIRFLLPLTCTTTTTTVVRMARFATMKKNKT